MSRQTYSGHFEDRHGVAADGAITDFVSRRGGRLHLGDSVDLNTLVERYGAPLEVAYCPLITTQVERMQRWAAEARAASGYGAEFVYAYATKANFAEEVVRTAITAGAHYETSASADLVIAHQLWRQGVLPGDRYIFANGSKDRAYVQAIVELRHAGHERLVPIVDDLHELDQLVARCREPLTLGVRARFAPEHVDETHPGGDRFGLTQAEIAEAARRLEGTPHRLVLYHVMVGSQIEDADAWAARLRRSAEEYCELKRLAPDLEILNFGGGMPTSAYEVGFGFDYAGFLRRVMELVAETCGERGVAQPTLVGEFGRYTVASHSVFLMEVGSVKRGQPGAPDWFLLNGSMMVTLPDMLIVDGQQFVILPLDGWERPAVEARLGGRSTCDTDDFFPRGGQPPLTLPAFEGEGPYVLAFFGVGAYQQMISGRGGAHHCLTPEMRRVIIEQDDDALVIREVAPQNLGQIMGLLGYQRETLEPAPLPRPAAVTSAASGDRRPIRESVLAARTPRRRQPTFPPRPVTLRDPRGVTSA